MTDLASALSPISTLLGIAIAKLRSNFWDPIAILAGAFRRGQAPREKAIRRFLLVQQVEIIKKRAVHLIVRSGIGLVLLSIVLPLILGLLTLLFLQVTQLFSEGCAMLLVIAFAIAALPIATTLTVLQIGLLLAFSLFATVSSGLWIAAFLAGRHLNKGSLEISQVRALEREMEHWLHEQARLRIFNEANLEVHHALNLITPIFWSKSDGIPPSDLLWRITDEALFFGAYSSIHLFFTDNYLAIYRCDYNFITGETVEDLTFEAYYTDIISFWTGQTFSSEEISTGDKLGPLVELSLVLASNEKINLGRIRPNLRSLLLGKEDRATPQQGGPKTLSTGSAEVDQTIEQVRRLVRDKKHFISTGTLPGQIEAGPSATSLDSLLGEKPSW